MQSRYCQVKVQLRDFLETTETHIREAKMKKEIRNRSEDFNEVQLSFEPFFQLLKENDLSQNALKINYEISGATLSRMKHGRNMTLASLGRLMKILGVADLNRFVKITYRRRK